MNVVSYLIAFNIFAIPFIIYTHVKGVCNLLIAAFGEGGKALCEYTTNPLINLFYLNVIFIMLTLLIYANSQVVPSAPPKKPSHLH